MRRLPFEYAVRNLGRSPTRLALSLAGSALVVLLVMAAAAFVRGMTVSLYVSGHEHNVILLGAGSEESIERSQVDLRTAAVASASLHGVRERLGVRYVSPEVHAALAVKLGASEQRGRLTVVRGIQPVAYLVHPQVRVVAGRAPEPGRDEVMLGALVPAKLGVDDEALAPGSRLWIDRRPWSVVGRFAAPHTVMEAEIWMPLSDLQVVAQRDTLSCVVLTLDPARGGEMADVQALAAERLDLEIVAMRESDYYRELAAFFAPIRVMVVVTALLIALGAVFGGLNTMYAAFATRVRELGMLQVIGYGRLALVLSLVQESIVTTSAAALVATGVGLVFLDGVAVRFSMGAFGLVVDPPVVAAGIVTGLTLGVIGALPPALRCLRLPINEALRA